MDKTPLVLIVEDSPTQAKGIAAMLENHRVRTIIASDGLQGLCAASEQQPDLVILDVNLPQMDGYQVCRRLKRDKNTAHIPVVMLTVSDSSEATVQGLEVGADDYIPKDTWASENLLMALRAFLPIGQ
jgi:DNA-binding response OmpR family regulator